MFESSSVIQILPLLSRLVPLFNIDVNNKTSWVFLGVFPIYFPFLFSVYLLYISQPSPQDPLGHSEAIKCVIRIEVILII